MISRESLAEQRADAVARAEHAASALADLVHDRQGSNDDDEHDPEGVTLSSEWSRLSALAEAAADEVRQYDDALALKEIQLLLGHAMAIRPPPPIVSIFTELRLGLAPKG